MDLKSVYMYFTGYVNISIEGFFTERFINGCFANGIMVWNLKREKSTYLTLSIRVQDFKKIKRLAKNTKCKIKILKKTGVPILLHKYRKRKVFAATLIVIAIFIFTLTRFIWNIEIVGLENIEYNDMISLLEENGIEVGMYKNSFDKEKVINEIRLERGDISWIGIETKGTNLIVTLNEAEEAPEIVDLSVPCNIVADRSGVISSIIVQNGTARVSVGDEVQKGDLLVEGVMEGEYTGIRYVHAMAEITANTYYEKEEKESLVQNQESKTGNEEKKIEIKLNNFKINFNKGVPNFEKYDTIKTTKKLKFFSNYYLPIEVSEITYIETKLETVEYTVEELTTKMQEELEEELDEELNLENKENVTENLEVEVLDGEVTAKLTYIIQERIGTNENLSN